MHKPVAWLFIIITNIMSCPYSYVLFFHTAGSAMGSFTPASPQTPEHVLLQHWLHH